MGYKLQTKPMIQLPEKIEVLKEEQNRTVFEISPLYPGYGITIGNALRRILLSSIQGAAIVTVKIKGVSHEFSTIDGVLENVIEILINLKKIRLKLFSEEPVTLQLKVSGEKEIKAKDIKTTSDVEIINQDEHIATLTDKKAELDMEIVVEKGIGYVPVEQRQKEKISVGTLAIDAIFSPVKNANFTIENIRVGQRTDYNKLVFEVETDGTVKPKDAMIKAVKIMTDHLNIMTQRLGEETETNNKPSEDSEEKSTKKNKKKAKKE